MTITIDSANPAHGALVCLIVLALLFIGGYLQDDSEYSCLWILPGAATIGLLVSVIVLIVRGVTAS